MNKFSIRTYIQEKASILENMDLVYDGKTINLIKELKSTPRAWKHLRFDKFDIKLPKRSIYDHMISLSISAESFLDELNLDLDRKKIADFILFHDLAEAIMWDVPFFTSCEIAKLVYKTKEQKDEEERIINKFFIDNFPESLKDDFQIYEQEFFQEADSEEKRFLNFIDRFDPILNIWTYLLKFKDEIDISYFLQSMADFFDNPKVKDYAYISDLYETVIFFQNKENAFDFYNGWIEFLKAKEMNRIRWEIIWKLIDREGIHYCAN